MQTRHFSGSIENNGMLQGSSVKFSLLPICAPLTRPSSIVRPKPCISSSQPHVTRGEHHHEFDVMQTRFVGALDDV